MRIVSLLFVACFLLPVGTFAQRVKLNKGKPSSRSYLTSVDYKNVEGKIIIPVKIEGTTYDFLFDTGAPNLITKSLSEKISSRLLDEISVRDANDSRRMLKVVSIPVISIGSTQFEDIPTIVNDPTSNFILDCFGVDGIIGSNMMRKSVVHIDSENFVLSVSNEPSHFGVSELEAIELSLSKAQSSPYMWIRLKGGGKAREYVLFDTGMHGFYDMSIDNYEKLKELVAFQGEESGKGSKSIGLFNSVESDTHFRVTIPEIEVGSSGFKNVKTITMSADRSRIGSELLDFGKVTIDYKNSKLYFEPNGKERDLDEKSLGFSPTIRDEQIVVGVVWSSSLTDKLNFGDPILKINELEISEMDPCEFVNNPSPFKSEETFKIRFLDKETQQEFELEMKKE